MLFNLCLALTPRLELQHIGLIAHWLRYKSSTVVRYWHSTVNKGKLKVHGTMASDGFENLKVFRKCVFLLQRVTVDNICLRVMQT